MQAAAVVPFPRAATAAGGGPALAAADAVPWGPKRRLGIGWPRSVVVRLRGRFHGRVPHCSTVLIGARFVRANTSSCFAGVRPLASVADTQGVKRMCCQVVAECRKRRGGSTVMLGEATWCSCLSCQDNIGQIINCEPFPCSTKATFTRATVTPTDYCKRPSLAHVPYSFPKSVSLRQWNNKTMSQLCAGSSQRTNSLLRHYLLHRAIFAERQDTVRLSREFRPDGQKDWFLLRLARLLWSRYRPYSLFPLLCRPFMGTVSRTRCRSTDHSGTITASVSPRLSSPTNKEAILSSGPQAYRRLEGCPTILPVSFIVADVECVVPDQRDQCRLLNGPRYFLPRGIALIRRSQVAPPNGR